ncbi:hypothetical protein LO80_04065 [Candidatus Francisella endociliophora]|uniref:N-acetyltransferase domain-containing protein n=1 Tax=Candidatus Francisella endociliophora TaxID=653937 RepID=A0A097ENU2_9GAMM|nr:GNAT family N-acetyltransferase [Francisella sp. FSC1006]AIT09230.1 hypothetical protein LO80_04065 [Francisella sp. FSC1006]
MLRYATFNDIEQLENIRIQSISSLTKHYSTQQLNIWKSLKPDWSKLYELTQIYCLNDSKVAGFITATKTELKLLYIDPKYQKMGIGTFLVSNVENVGMICDANILTEKILIKRN